MESSEPDPPVGGSAHLRRLSLPALHAPEPYAGAEMVHEVPIGPAVLLIQAYRNVMAWALAPPREHAELFPPTAGEEMRETLAATPMHDELRRALEVFCALLDDAVVADPRRVAAACTRIVEWAQLREAPRTAFHFAQAAGMCASGDARLAYRAGCLARQRGEWDLAQLWFRHAISVGRRTRDWEGHALGYLALGNNYYRQGKYPAARREHLKALRVGKRYGLREIQGKAYHDLFAVAVETREPGKAEEHGRAAFNAYGAEHPAIPTLAHDMAYFWNTQEQFSRSLPVFRALLSHFREPEDRLRVLASAARAAGGAGEREIFEQSRVEIGRLVEDLGDTAVVITSLMQLAYGAASLSDWEHAESAAEHALVAARHRGEADVVSSAERLLDAVSSRSAELRVSPGRVSSTTHEADPFVHDLVASLEASSTRR